MADYSDVASLTILLEELEVLWKSETNMTSCIYKLQHCFNSSINPFISAMFLCEHASDFAYGKSNTLSSGVMRQFETWSEANYVQKQDLLTSGIRACAFNLATRRHTTLLPYIVRSFHLDVKSEERVPQIKELIVQKMFKEAAQSVALLNLQNHFQMDEILLPCLLQDKIFAVENYLVGCPDLQLQVCQLLDSYLAPKFNFRNLFWKFSYVPSIVVNKFEPKTLHKLLGRFIKSYNISAEHTPHFNNFRAAASMRYYVAQRYRVKEGAMDYQIWSDMVEGLATINLPFLGPVLLNALCHVDIPEAAIWASRLHIPPADWPNILLAAVQKYGLDDLANQAASVKSLTNETLPSEGPESSDILRLPSCMMDRTKIVDNDEGLKRCMENVAQATLLGLDTEWRPSYASNQKQVGIMQLATTEDIYIIDLVKLENSAPVLVLQEFMQLVFSNDAIRKLGFNFTGDLKALLCTLPECREQLMNIRNTICLQTLSQVMHKMNPAILEGIEAQMKKPLIPMHVTVARKPAAVADSTDTLALEQLEINDSVATADVADGDAAGLEQTQKSDSLRHKYQLALSDLCLYFLGKTLQKGQQMSNWARRPLRPEQIDYAALDAYCQLDIYDKMKSKAQLLGIDFEAACMSSLVSASDKPSKARKRTAAEKRLEAADFVQMLQSHNAALSPEGTRQPRDLRVAVDTMLHGLGKHLRRCGLDCFIPGRMDSAQTCLEVALKEGRLFVTAGSAFVQAVPRFPEGTVLCAPHMADSRDQLMWFLKHMKVHVAESDIFSRCMLCNRAPYLHLPADQLQQIALAHLNRSSVNCEPKSDNRSNHPIDEANEEENIETDAVNYGRRSFLQDNAAVGTFNEQKKEIVFDSGVLDLTSAVFYPNNSPSGVLVHIEEVHPATLERFDDFYVCQGCGKVYWEGTHFPRYMKKVGEAIDHP